MVSGPGRARPPSLAGAVAAAVVRPLSLLLLFLLLVAVATVPWAAAAVLPAWALVVAADAVERRRSLPAAPPVAAIAAPPTGVDGSLAARAERALRAEQAVLRELDALPAEPPGLRAQVERLRVDLLEAVTRAARVDDYLAGLDLDELRVREAACRADPRRGAVAEALAEQIRVAEALRERRAVLEHEMDHVEVGLGAVRGQLVAIAAGAAVRGGLDEEVAVLRGQVRAAADGFAEAYGHNDPD